MCEIKRFHSVDFDKTPPAILVRLPENLRHENVLNNRENQAFSMERKHPVYLVDLPSHAISMTIGSLNPSGHSNRHRHTYETILYVLEGEGCSIIEDRCVEWKKGDAVYIPVWAWHHHVNLDPKNIAVYLACENAPMLQNSGGLAIREESPHSIGDTNNACTA